MSLFLLFGPEALVRVWTGVTNRPYYLCTIIKGKKRPVFPPTSLQIHPFA